MNLAHFRGIMIKGKFHKSFNFHISFLLTVSEPKKDCNLGVYGFDCVKTLLEQCQK